MWACGLVPRRSRGSLGTRLNRRYGTISKWINSPPGRVPGDSDVARLSTSHVDILGRRGAPVSGPGHQLDGRDGGFLLPLDGQLRELQWLVDDGIVGVIRGGGAVCP